MNAACFCSACGAANPPGARSCFACNQPLTPLTSLPSTPHPPPAPPVLVAASSPASPGLGSLLHGRYKLVREIGQGGFGVVYLAEDGQRHYQKVAIKQINIGKVSVRESIDATDSYNREVTLLSKLKHRRLPRIYDHFTDPEHWYLVLDYIEGQTLEASVEATPDKVLPVKKVLDIGLQVCDILEYLHSQKPPIIFRDVKPANIMQTARGQIYLIDFGIARQFSPGRVKDTGPLGSPGYAAPEQYGKSQTTIHTDIYGLGATLQTLVMGKDPLELQAGAASLSPAPRLPRKFRLLLSQMLEKESSKRPQSIREVKASLEDVRRGRGRFVRRSLWGLLLGVAPYLLFSALVLLMSVFPSPPMTFLFPLMIALYCLWPLLFLGQLMTALLLLFLSRKRLIGLGILIGLAIFVLVVFFQVKPFSSLLPWPPSLGD